MQVETKEIWVGTKKREVSIKRFSNAETEGRLMKFPAESFVQETKYVARIINMCCRRDERLRDATRVSYGDFLNVYKAILEVNPQLQFENYAMSRPGVRKKEADSQSSNQTSQKGEQEILTSNHASLEEVVSMLDFGELESNLNREVIGQRPAIKQLLNGGINVKHMGISEKGCAVDYLHGPSGVGKTSSVKYLAKFFGIPILQIQGSDYKNETANTKLFGGDPNYLGYDKDGGHLQRFVKRNPSSIILIDEIDKLNPEVISSLTSFFGDGFLTIASSELEIPFKGLVYLTSNAGNKSSERGTGELGFKDKGDKSDSEIETERILNLLRKGGIGDEFLGRINNFIHFGHLSRANIEIILDKNLGEFNEKLKYYNFNLTESAREGFLKACDTDAFGAREIRRNIQKLITSPISHRYEMKKDIPKFGMVSVDFEDGKFTHSISEKTAVKTRAV